MFLPLPAHSAHHENVKIYTYTYNDSKEEATKGQHGK